MNLSGFSMILLFGFNIVFLLSVIFAEHKRPQSTVAWILVLTLLPVAGGVFYLLFGTTLNLRFRGRMKKKYKSFRQAEEELYRYLQLPRPEFDRLNQKEFMPYKNIAYMLFQQAGSFYTEHNDVKLFTDAELLYQDLFTEMQKAEKSIHAEYFIIRNDPVGCRFIALLAEKARQGVEVRLLYDEFGSLSTNMKLFSPILQAGGKVCRYFSTHLSNLLRLNHRNHRKILVVDGKIGYTGGMNLGMEYMGKKKITPWRDSHIKLTGACVNLLQIRFLLDWMFSCEETLPEANRLKEFFPPADLSGTSGVQIVSGGPDSDGESIKYGYLKMINSAHQRIYIQTPYFVPDESMLQGLILAARSGVDVRLMIPGIPDKSYVYAITLSYVEELLKCGVRVFLHPGFIHAKTIVVDSFVSSVGTANFDVRSFALNFEINAFIYDRSFAMENIRVFHKDASVCQELSYETFRRRNVFRKITERIFRLFAPLA